jgi:hypothetical protein
MTGDSKKYCVIHGHFYQPPRESPWLGEIERQESAGSYHNWNERIFDECYRPNSFSRILDSEGKIVGVSNNYSYMSFNFGPTLFSWLDDKHPEVVARIVDADRRSCEMYNGHGSAVAQVYNHIIMPHASKKDKITQIRWSKSFFKKHFNRDPEGMWLAETAINMETVECLIDEDIKFVILSPNQAESFRDSSKSKWKYCSDQGLDPKVPYRCYLDNADHTATKKYIDVFFFDEPLSRAISFEGLLDNADILTDRINSCFSHNPTENELVTIATDGETFGHHKKNGDMCLAYFFRQRAKESNIEVVNFAYYLSVNPPVREVKLKNSHGEGTAWSCAHGTGRWIRDCGCETGGQKGWNQSWRGPFREAVDYLQSEIDLLYDSKMSKYFKDPAEIRNLFEPFIDSQDGIEQFLQKQAKKKILADEIGSIISLLEAQKFILYAYTSCAWFFSDISGIETIQNIRYALRAWQLTWPNEESNPVLRHFSAILSEAHSNILGVSGKTILVNDAKPALAHLERAAFTAALDHYIYDDKKDLNLGAYKIELNRFGKEEVDGKKWQLFDIEVEHINSRENKKLLLAIFSNRGRNIEGVVFPTSVKKQLQKSPEDFNELMSNSREMTFSLKDVLDSYRSFVTDQFVDEFASETLLDYLSWAGMQGSRLDAITELNDGLPGELAEIVSFFLNKEWDIQTVQLVKQSSSANLTESLDEVLRRASHYHIEINKCKSADLFTTEILSDLKELNSKFSFDLNKAIVDKVGVVLRYDIPVRFSQLQDSFYLTYKKCRKICEKLDSEPTQSFREEVAATNALAEKLGYNTSKTQL